MTEIEINSKENIKLTPIWLKNCEIISEEATILEHFNEPVGVKKSPIIPEDKRKNIESIK